MNYAVICNIKQYRCNIRIVDSDEAVGSGRELFINFLLLKKNDFYICFIFVCVKLIFINKVATDEKDLACVLPLGS